MIARGEESRIASNNNLRALTERLSTLADQMKTEQSLMLKLAESQMEMKPILARLADNRVSQGIDETTRGHIRNIDSSLARMVDEATGARDELVRDIRNEFRLLTRTIAVLAEDDANSGPDLRAPRERSPMRGAVTPERRRASMSGRASSTRWPRCCSSSSSSCWCSSSPSSISARFFSGRDQTITRLSKQLDELTDLLDLERQSNSELKVNIGKLTEQLAQSTAERDALQAQANQNAADHQQVALLQNDVEALKALKAELEKRSPISAPRRPRPRANCPPRRTSRLRPAPRPRC